MNHTTAVHVRTPGRFLSKLARAYLRRQACNSSAQEWVRMASYRFILRHNASYCVIISRAHFIIIIISSSIIARKPDRQCCSERVRACVSISSGRRYGCRRRGEPTRCGTGVGDDVSYGGEVGARFTATSGRHVTNIWSQFTSICSPVRAVFSEIARARVRACIPRDACSR